MRVRKFRRVRKEMAMKWQTDAEGLPFHFTESRVLDPSAGIFWNYLFLIKPFWVIGKVRGTRCNRSQIDIIRLLLNRKVQTLRELEQGDPDAAFINFLQPGDPHPKVLTYLHYRLESIDTSTYDGMGSRLITLSALSSRNSPNPMHCDPKRL